VFSGVLFRSLAAPRGGLLEEDIRAVLDGEVLANTKNRGFIIL
jgi:hypothetical protein